MITEIFNEAEKILKEKNTFRPKYISRQDFTTLRFTLEDPVTCETIKEYKFAETEFRRLPYKEKCKFNRLIIEKNFDEEQYNKALKKNKKDLKKFQQLLNKTYFEVLESKSISKEQEDKFNKIIDVISEYFDLEDLGEARIVFEDEILEILK